MLYFKTSESLIIITAYKHIHLTAKAYRYVGLYLENNMTLYKTA